MELEFLPQGSGDPRKRRRRPDRRHKEDPSHNKGEKEATESTAPALPTDRGSSLDYLTAVLHHTIKDQGLFGSSDTNVTVVHILDAARESVRTGKTILLKRCRSTIT